MLIGDYVNMNFQWEGRAYVGFPAMLLALSVCLYLLHKLTRWQKVEWRLFFPNRNLNVYLVAALLVLLFSMAFPFKYGFAFLLELLPPVKQFRAVGRFAWIFYYVFTVYTAYYLYTLFRRLKIRGLHLLSILLLLFALGFWCIDAGTNIKRSISGIFNTNDRLESSDAEYQSRFTEARVNPDDFQAIFFLPFASTSGDKLFFERGSSAFTEAMKCSYHTEIPLIQSFSPRLSFTHALSSIQLLADSAIYKNRLEDMNDKPILLVTTRQQLNEREARLKTMARDFWEDKYITLSALPVESFNRGNAEWKKYVSMFRDSLSCDEKICSDTDPRQLYYDGFEELESEMAFSGSGAVFRKTGEAEILNMTWTSDSASIKSEISFWVFIDTRTDNMPEPYLYIRDADKQLHAKTKLESREVHDVTRHWARVATEFDLHNGMRYQLVVKGKYITIDDLLIRPVGSHVLVKSGETELFNNFPVPR